MAPGPIPPGLSSFSFGLREEVFALGVGVFAGAAFAQEAQSSLATDPRFSEALRNLNGSSNASLMYIDVRGIREAVETAIPSLPQEYQAQFRPFLLPLDRIVSVTTGDSTRQIGRFTFIVSEPQGQ